MVDEHLLAAASLRARDVGAAHRARVDEQGDAVLALLTQDLNQVVDRLEEDVVYWLQDVRIWVELESDWQVNDRLNVEMAYGLLVAEFVDYAYEKDVYDENWEIIGSETIDKSGRQTGHAPSYSMVTALTYQLSDALSVRFENEAKDEFYFSDSHDEKAKAYVLWHAKLAYDKPTYSLAVYGRNLTDQDYETRGFGGFNNDALSTAPDDEGRYVQYGEPLTYGIEGKFYF